MKSCTSTTESWSSSPDRRASPWNWRSGFEAVGVSDYGRESIWRDTATASSERARDLAERLERRARAVDEIAARDAYLGLLDIAPGAHVLDVGCGSGAVTREIAKRVGSPGHT